MNSWSCQWSIQKYTQNADITRESDTKTQLKAKELHWGEQPQSFNSMESLDELNDNELDCILNAWNEKLLYRRDFLVALVDYTAVYLSIAQ